MKPILIGLSTSFMFASTAFATPTLDIDGACPGDVTIDITGTPNSWIGLFAGEEGGSHTFGGGPCGGATLDIGNARFIGKARTDGDGLHAKSKTLGMAACGTTIQAIDMSDCSVSDVDSNPAPIMTPYYVGFEWGLGYDAASDMVVSVSSGADTYDALVILNIYDYWFSASCQVWYEFPEASMAEWRDDSGAIIGFDVPVEAEVDSNCGTYNGHVVDWDRDLWGDNPTEVFRGDEWQIGIQHLTEDEFAADLEAAVIDAGYDWDADWYPSIMTGGLYTDPGVENSAYGWMYEVDGSMELTVDKAGYLNELTVADIDVDATAYYDFYEYYVWSGLFYYYSTIESVQPILDTSCTSCHSGKSPSAGLDMSSGNAWANTVGVASSQAAMDIVSDSGDPEDSYLWHKVNGTHIKAGGSGDQMPQGASALSADDLDVIYNWMVDGAMP
jgi:hypothetical protein